MKKIFYFDVETTGLSAEKNGIIQLAYLVEIDGELKEEGNLLMQPFPGDKIEASALQVNKRTIEEIKSEAFMPPKEAYSKLVSVLGKYVDKFNRNDKFFVSGYNVNFDVNFLSEFFKKNNDNYVGSWFNFRKLDPLLLLHFLDYAGAISLPDYKLQTLCNHFGIEIQAHDALSDIKATRELWLKLYDREAICRLLKKN